MLPTATVTFPAVDATCLVTTATIRHGSDDPTSWPDASAATLDIVGALPPGVDIGDVVTVDATVGATTYRRFWGRITDLALGWEDPDHPAVRVIAVGDLAMMGRRVIGDEPWPQELDGTRANRAITLAEVRTSAPLSDPGTVETLARDTDAQTAVSVAQDASVDGDGYLWETVDGFVVYADAEHRRGVQTSLTLNACHIDTGAVWIRNLDGLVNDLRLRYGPDPQVELRGTDDTSIADRGRYAASVTTTIANEPDATARLNLRLVRQSEPSWVLSGVTVHLGALGNLTASTAEDAALTAALLGLEIHDLIAVTALPAGSPYITAQLFVEGWQESIRYGSWSIGLVVSDYCRTSAVPHWNDVDPAWTWDTVDAAMTWDDTTCMPPQQIVGRWDDVPASTRWDGVAATVTWNTWVG